MITTLTAIIAPIAIVLFAVATNTPPDLTGIAAIVTAVVGVCAFIVSMVKGAKNNKRVEEVEQAASYVAGFDALVKRLQEEVDDLRGELNQERKKWGEERAQLLETIRTLRSELNESIAQHSVTRGELSELKGQIKGFLSEGEYEEFTKHL